MKSCQDMLLIHISGDRQRFLSCLLTIKTEIDQETLCPMSKLTSATLSWLQEVADITSAKTIGKIDSF